MRPYHLQLPEVTAFDRRVTNRLVFFERGASRRRRVVAGAFTVWFLVVLTAILWPVYALVGHARPFVLGLPFSFFWVILWLLVSFTGLLLLYLFRYRGEE